MKTISPQSSPVRHLGVAALALFLSACSDSNSSSSSDSISWAECEDGSADQCARFTVPLDYSKPSARQITLALRRVSATGAGPHTSLLFNPGGPGSGGVQMVQDMVQSGETPASLRERYHFIGFDPRGVGESELPKCTMADEQLIDLPLDAQDLQDNEAGLRAAWDRCDADDKAFIQQMGSLNVVRDMDKLRIALSESKLHFYGVSYGTRLGGLYAREFPFSTGRMVLDASMHPTIGLRQIALDNVVSTDVSMRTAFSICPAFVTDCDVNDFFSKVNERVALLKQRELEAPSDANLEELEGLQAKISIITDEIGATELVLPAMHAYINDPSDVNREALFALSFDELESGDEALADESDEESEGETAGAFSNVMCADEPERTNAAEAEALRSEYRAESLIQGDTQLNTVLMCAPYPAPLNPIGAIATTQAPQLLVITGALDPATPEHWGVAMASAIGAKLLKSDHFGHGVSYTDQSSCVDDIVTDYLLNSRLPSVDSCSVDP